MLIQWQVERVPPLLPGLRYAIFMHMLSYSLVCGERPSHVDTVASYRIEPPESIRLFT